ncbi:GNAT family N-acetyltransferase [Demequina lutea]|uniref:GNAT superfamily N-acetyltransferase n=1 Tax=Demequina lutea TaxID=431489 RepID=A0A7Z0CHY2_9MICO|nr:GNAT family N-acetyltransferase [Demequina lutea]NYI41309.1 GNAT superfamily N-acetyltransferase [Demequina lutea]
MRAATAADVRAISEFQTACWREAYVGLVPNEYLERVDADAREARWLQRAGTDTRNVAVGHVATTLAGVVSWSICAEPGVPPLELKSLYVGSAFYGSGVAAALLTHALGEAPAHLWVFESNPRAHAFYAKWGFTFDGSRKVDPDTGVWERRLVRT